MRRFGALIVVLLAIALVTVARSGHEMSVYPSYYPHEIEIRTLAPAQAAGLLRDNKIQAYVGDLPPADWPDFIRPVESLGSFVVVRTNPQSGLATDAAATCALVETVIHEMAGRGGAFVFHPYPVTPLHGDYLYHADLAAAAQARFLHAASDRPAFDRRLKIKTSGSPTQNLIRPEWSARDGDWDAEIVEVGAAGLVASATVAINGWVGPPWLRNGWFQAERLLADTIPDPERKQRVASDLTQLTSGDIDGLAARINLERDLVTALTSGCGTMVAGYTVKREYVSAEYSAGIENIGYDAISGLHSPMFLRTVKLKDFPWNGWLALGIDVPPTAAWNPIGGVTDRFGRLMWDAVGDSALIPSPYEAGWMLNRISDVRGGQ